MEFPELGAHCNYVDCERLDFLPVKCNCCGLKFCSKHSKEEDHKCTQSEKKRDRQSVTCPVCNGEVVYTIGENPDTKVWNHIQAGCEEKLKQRIHSRGCEHKKCKVLEIKPVVCNHCHKQFCLNHRYTSSHNCTSVLSNSPSTITKSIPVKVRVR
eukprot:TRINITY_DN184_c0_g1_i1.p1 TRINITY_DN184_c0_g1~~TRINITY_DN184_c0_g1_i1.p1  ORF type:complete len:155 (-),score=13.32 TRINITY_DN184_c0_g1_i1:119-583(-)